MSTDAIPKGCVSNLLSNATCSRGSFRCDRQHRAEPQIACPLCGELVQQVASATLDLALSQHVTWLHPEAKASRKESLQDIQRRRGVGAAEAMRIQADTGEAPTEPKHAATNCWQQGYCRTATWCEHLKRCLAETTPADTGEATPAPPQGFSALKGALAFDMTDAEFDEALESIRGERERELRRRVREAEALPSLPSESAKEHK